MMSQTRRFLPLAAAAVAAGALVTRPAAACDPDQMDAYLAAVCDGALAPARQAIDAALGHATPEEAAAMRRALALATEAGNTGDPVAGARIAARLARLAGRIEGRAGAAAAPIDLLA